MKELQTIIDGSKDYDAVDTTAFAGPTGTFWTSSPKGTNAWGVEFVSGGEADTFVKTTTMNVRCVR